MEGDQLFKIHVPEPQTGPSWVLPRKKSYSLLEPTLSDPYQSTTQMCPLVLEGLD